MTDNTLAPINWICTCLLIMFADCSTLILLIECWSQMTEPCAQNTWSLMTSEWQTNKRICGNSSNCEEWIRKYNERTAVIKNRIMQHLKVHIYDRFAWPTKLDVHFGSWLLYILLAICRIPNRGLGSMREIHLYTVTPPSILSTRQRKSPMNKHHLHVTLA